MAVELVLLVVTVAVIITIFAMLTWDVLRDDTHHPRKK